MLPAVGFHGEVLVVRSEICNTFGQKFDARIAASCSERFQVARAANLAFIGDPPGIDGGKIAPALQCRFSFAKFAAIDATALDLELSPIVRHADHGSAFTRRVSQVPGATPSITAIQSTDGFQLLDPLRKQPMA